MKSFELTQAEIEICIRGLICQYNEYGLSDEEQKLLDKLEKLATL